MCRGKFATIYDDPAYKAWKVEAIEKLKELAKFEDFRDVADHPVRVTVEVSAFKPKTSKLAAPKPDADNYLKGILDAITQSEKWWTDDSQIVEAIVTKRWAEHGATAEGYWVTVEFLS